MKYFKDYSNTNNDNYKIIALGDTSPIQKNQELEETLLFKNNDFVRSVKNGEWDGKPIDLNHEATENPNFTKYGTIKKTFINDEGFVSISGKEYPATEGENKTIYAIIELTKEGKQLFKEQQNMTTSSYFSYSDDDGVEAVKHGDDDKKVKVVTDIKPISLSLLVDKEPKIKIEDKYIINSSKEDNKYNITLEDKIDLLSYKIQKLL